MVRPESGVQRRTPPWTARYFQTSSEAEAATIGLSFVCSRVCRRLIQFRARLSQNQAGMASPEVATTSDPSETKNLARTAGSIPYEKEHVSQWRVTTYQ